MKKYEDRDADKIRERRWTDIRSEWINYVPDHESPWPIPEHEIYELPGLELRLGNLGGPEKKDSTIEDEIVGLRIAALHEAVILIHKAGNVLRAAAKEGSLGFRTWSRSSSYHAAFFAMRGVLSLLGVMLFRGRDRQSEYQVDLWAPRVQRKKPGPTESRYAVRIIQRRRVEHKEMWGIFSRVLRVTKIDNTIWPLLSKDPLKNLDPGRFSIVRHQIHYRSVGWLFNDLDSVDSVDDFSRLAAQVADLNHLENQEGDYFTPALALYILSMGTALITDLGEDIPKLGKEAERARKWMEATPWKRANVFDLVHTGGAR